MSVRVRLLYVVLKIDSFTAIRDQAIPTTFNWCSARFIFWLHCWSSVNAFVSVAGGVRFKSRAGQIGQSNANGLPPPRHFFERSFVRPGTRVAWRGGRKIVWGHRQILLSSSEMKTKKKVYNLAVNLLSGHKSRSRGARRNLMVRISLLQIQR